LPDVSKKNLEALQASRAHLDRLLNSFDPRTEIQAIASKSYENICRGNRCNNLLDTKWHTTDFKDRDYHIFDTLYSLAVNDGSTEIDVLDSIDGEVVGFVVGERDEVTDGVTEGTTVGLTDGVTEGTIVSSKDG
jgi:hypothetical protein